MITKSRLFFTFSILLSFVYRASIVPDSAAEHGKPALIPVPENGFVFTEGAWSEYEVSGDREYRFRISVFEKEKYRGREGRWLEVGVTSAGEPAVTTRFLAEESSSGPGRILRLIIQIEGTEPFTAPSAFLKSGEAPHGFNRFKPPEDAVRGRIAWRGAELEVFSASFYDEDGGRAEVIISPEIKPLGIVSFESGEILMSVESWGDNPKSGISGRAGGFIGWLARKFIR